MPIRMCRLSSAVWRSGTGRRHSVNAAVPRCGPRPDISDGLMYCRAEHMPEGVNIVVPLALRCSKSGCMQLRDLDWTTTESFAYCCGEHVPVGATLLDRNVMMKQVEKRVAGRHANKTPSHVAEVLCAGQIVLKARLYKSDIIWRRVSLTLRLSMTRTRSCER